MATPEMTPIKSSMMSGYAYDPNTRDLHIEFRPGSVYTYHDVSAEKVEAMREAKSPGGYFSAKIKPNHKVTKL